MRLPVQTRSWLCAVLLTAVALYAGPLAARMYQWTSPTTGSTQMSGEPPTWYRSGVDGPRVLVFENGYLVDDTGIAVSAARRRALRNRAFEVVAERRVLEAMRRIAAGRASERDLELAETAEPSLFDKAARAVDEAAATVSDTAAALPEALDAASIERLKEIIADFDRRGGATR